MILLVAVRVFWDTLSTTWDAVARQYAARRSRVKVKYRTVSNQLLVCLRVAENTSQVRLDGSGIVSNERREGRGRRLAGSQRTVWGVCQTSSTEVHYCCHLPSTTEKVNVLAPVRLSVCLSVCDQDYSKTYAWIWMKCCVSTDVGTWTNWLTFEPDLDYSPNAGTGLLYPISYALQRVILLRRKIPPM